MSDGEDLELNEDMEIGDEADQQTPEDQEAGEFVIELEGEEPGEDVPLVKKLRQEIRERDRRLAERTTQEQEIVVGDKPTLESCEYDEDRFDRERDAWDARRLAAARLQDQRQTAEQQRAAEYRDLEISYRASAAKLPVKQEDFDAADQAVRAALPEAVQIAIAKYIPEPAKVVMALGKYPARLDAIAAEPDPVRQLFMIRDLQGAIKVRTHRATPEPETGSILRGSASISAGADKQLQKLEQEASRTGDRSKIIAYKASKKKAA